MTDSTNPTVISRGFAHTAAALVVYDAHADARRRLWDGACSNTDVEAAEVADVEALALVQVAFHADTHDINSMAHCMQADLNFLRQCATVDSETITVSVVDGPAVPFLQVPAGARFLDLEMHLMWVRRDGNQAECVDEWERPCEPEAFENDDEVVLAPSL